jgi:small subunit ribosomal protein S9
MKESKWYYGTGRRKRAVARVYIKESPVNIFYINGLLINQYFTNNAYNHTINKVVKLVGGAYIMKVNVRGGGKSCQAGAISLGLSRALVCLDPCLRYVLSTQKLLTRDSREVERKKLGLHKARKRKQFSKR